MSEDVVHHLGGFKLLLSNKSKDDGMVVYKSNPSDSDVIYPVVLHDILSRFVTITRNGILTICEVVILEGGIQQIINDSIFTELYKTF